MESLFEDKILINKDGKINLMIEKDLELDELLNQCKKKGLKFGLALGSGSARGLAHVGVIQTLKAYHIPIDMIAGTSIGAVIGSLSRKPSTLIIRSKIEEIKIRLERPNIFEVISQSIDIMEAKISEQSLKGADVVIIPFGMKDVHLFDFNKAEMLIKGGIIATLLNIPEIKRAIKEKLQE